MEPKERQAFVELLEQQGHMLERDEDGKIDWLALEAGHHNGPRCVTCNEAWCEHCNYTQIDECQAKGGRDEP